MTGAGLKKCSPTTSAGRSVAIAHSMTGSDEVVVASTTPGLQISSSDAKTAVLTPNSSTTASTTRSTSASSSSDADQRTRRSAASRSASVSLPFTTALSSERTSFSRARADFSALRLTAITS
jgi:hypothetical protein